MASDDDLGGVNENLVLLSNPHPLGRPLGYLIFSLMALIGDPIS